MAHKEDVVSKGEDKPFTFNVYFEGRLIASCTTLGAFLRVCKLMEHKERTRPPQIKVPKIPHWDPNTRIISKPLTCCTNPAECQLFIHGERQGSP